MLCYTLPEPSYLIFASGVPELLYYSHIPAIAVALLLGGFVFYKNPHGLPNRALLGVAASFSLLALVNLFIWTNIHSEVVVFLWSLFGLFSAAVSLFCIYFVYVFLWKKDMRFSRKLVLFGLSLPIILLTPTSLNLSGFNLELCGSSGYENIFFVGYCTSLGVLAIFWTTYLFIKRFFQTDTRARQEILLMAVGIELFLFSFFFATFLASYLNDTGISSDYSLEQYGFFGMIIFMGFIAFIITHFKAFNVGLLAAQALVVSLVILISSQLALITSITNTVITAITLVLTGILGIKLVRSVKKEIAQRERVEKLAKDLETANERLKEMDQMKSEFLSIASHQLRAPITAIKGYVSLIREGDYGVVPETMKEPLSNISESVRVMVSSIDDYLNVSRIEQNRMKYEISDVDIADIAVKAVSELQPLAQARKLTLSVTAPAPAIARADIGKIKQVVTNLIDNAIKYTKEGSVAVSVEQDTQKIRVTIADTGVGISKEDIDNLFQKFKRAAGANEVNTAGTGLGLYVARLLVEGHGGKVWAESEGKGKGSRFIVELPLIQKKPAEAVSSKVIPPPPRG